MSCLPTKCEVMSKVHWAVRGHTINDQAIRELPAGASRIMQEDEGRTGPRRRGQSNEQVHHEPPSKPPTARIWLTKLGSI
jgi:hypothetical protein